MTLKTIKELEAEKKRIPKPQSHQYTNNEWYSVVNEKLKQLNEVLEVIINAVNTLKNNYLFSREKETKEKIKEFAMGIYNRFDECGLIYSDIKGIGFNEAIKELELTELMEELESIINEK